MAVELLSPLPAVIPPANPHHVEQKIGPSTYALGLEPSGVDTVLHIFEKDGASPWVDAMQFTIKNSLGGSASLHALENGRLAVVFPARHDLAADAYEQDWILHYLTVDPADWTPAVGNILDTNYRFLPLEGTAPRFDSRAIGNTLHVAFEAFSNEDLLQGAGQVRLAYTRIEPENPTPIVALTIVDTFDTRPASLNLDYSTVDSMLFAAVYGLNYRYLYQLSPRVVLMTDLFDLREGQYCSRFERIFNFRANVGMTRDTPPVLTIHRTYNLPIPGDAYDLSYQFASNYWVIFFRSQDKLWNAVFDLDTRAYLGAKNVLNALPASYNVPKDDGDDRTFDYSAIYYSISGGFYRLTFEAVTAPPELVEPAENAYINTSAVEFVIQSPVESQGNNLTFKIRVEKGGRTYVFSSEQDVPHVSWFFQDGSAWSPLPGTGLPPALQGVKVMARVGRGALV